jgi:hypothetical protein
MNQGTITGPQGQVVTHLKVSADAYQVVLNILQELPYKTAAPALQALQNGTEAILPDEPTVDEPGDPGAES